MTLPIWALELWLLLGCIVFSITLTVDRVFGPMIGMLLWVVVNILIIVWTIRVDSKKPPQQK
jgi:uncharacterized membrane protein required for colicin V production